MVYTLRELTYKHNAIFYESRKDIYKMIIEVIFHIFAPVIDEVVLTSTHSL